MGGITASGTRGRLVLGDWTRNLELQGGRPDRQGPPEDPKTDLVDSVKADSRAEDAQDATLVVKRIYKP